MSSSSSSSSSLGYSSSSSSSSTEIRSSSSSSTEIRSSSSSSSSYSSSSSSLGYSSSSSSSSSSSTEIRSSSSSSSSYLDYSDDRTIPFVFETEDINPVWAMASYGEYVFAGTGSNGLLLRSKDRFFWEQIYSIDDVNIKSLLVRNNVLYIGTSPNGIIYTMNLLTNEVALSQTLGGDVFGFIVYKNKLYACGGIPNQVWEYNFSKNRWDAIYRLNSSIVYKMLLFNNKMYILSNSSNVISFDGDKWVLENIGIDNISSIRNVTTEPYSFVSEEFINRNNISRVVLSEEFSNEEIYDIHPINYPKGIGAGDVDGGSLVLGSDSYSKIYNLIDGKLYPIFQTDILNTIHYLLNLKVGVNLASIDNKLYLLYCGDLSSEEEDVEQDVTTTTTTTTLEPTMVSLAYPIGGELLAIGDTINIQWSSLSSINDAVKIELYKGNELNSVINPNTANDGSYEWNIPSILPANDYKIVLTWLSSTVSDKNVSSSGFLSILAPPLPTTTTTTTTLRDITIPETEKCYAIPLLELNQDEYITYMLKDNAKGGILFATSKGRIIGCEEAVVNAYLTGDRTVYAEVKDGFGNMSETTYTDFFYALYNKIAVINDDKEVVKWKYEEDASAILTDRITGVFLSPILSVKQDLNLWDQLMWRENKPDNTEIIICIRSADSEEELQKLPWDYCFVSNDSDRIYNSSGYIIRNLKDYHIKGKYLQFKVTMTTDAHETTPSLLSLSISYSTKFAIYFYTIKFALKNESDVKSGLIVANMTEPQNTEIKFGVAGTNSSDWNDYTVVSKDKLFSLNDLERMKVGIKMIAYDDNIPEVAEFSLLTGSTIHNKINEL